MLDFLKVPTVLVDGFSINTLVALPIAVVVALAYFAMARRGITTKIAAICLATSTLPAFSVAMIEQLSHSKELSLQWLRTQGEQGIVIHKAVIRPPVMIELMIEEDDASRLFHVPWSEELEKSLQDAMEQSQDGRKGQMRFRFERSWEKEPKFYSMPWPAPPSKDEKKPKVFKHEQET